ncbi:MAG: nucleotide modification associated domain-containing protein [Candidatus Uhrbacteria bacterium]|nr:nucleotide modification associated domain-containing protein [Candidatus Uhrbacteria bacterium]
MTDKPVTDFDQFLQETRAILDRCLVILSKKNHDYSEVTDAFSNFKSSAELAGITPAQSLLTLLGMKMARLSQLIGNGKQPMNEKTEDTIIDLINYTLLLRGVIQEESQTKNSL